MCGDMGALCALVLIYTLLLRPQESAGGHGESKLIQGQSEKVYGEQEGVQWVGCPFPKSLKC